MSERPMRPILMTGPMVRAILAGTKTQTRRVINPQPEPFVQGSPDQHPAKHAAPYLDAYCGARKTAENPRGVTTAWCWWTRDDRCGPTVARCPYGVPGDRLWVKETFQPIYAPGVSYRDTDWGTGKGYAPRYMATEPAIEYVDPDDNLTDRCKPSIHMPRWASRLTLEVTAVRVQRLQDISEEDIEAEGVHCPRCKGAGYERLAESFDNCREPNCGDHARPWFADLWDDITGKRAPWSSNPWVWAISFKRAA